jgi:membrane protein YqaA with SNARE-associated domain
MLGSAYRWAGQALFSGSFVESSFFPIRPDVMLIPMCIAQRTRAWYFAAVATVGSVIGGVFHRCKLLGLR